MYSTLSYFSVLICSVKSSLGKQKYSKNMLSPDTLHQQESVQRHEIQAILCEPLAVNMWCTYYSCPPWGNSSHGLFLFYGSVIENEYIFILNNSFFITTFELHNIINATFSLDEC